MCSHSTMKISFFILLQLTGIYSTLEVSLENDITKHTDNWVTSIFTSGETGPKQMIELYYNKFNEFEYNISNQENNVSTKYIFQNISIGTFFCTDDSSDNTDDSDNSDNTDDSDNTDNTDNTVMVQQITWKFSESKISAFLEGFHFYIYGDVKIKTSVSNYEKSSKIAMYPTFKNFTLTSLASYTKDNDLKITHDFTCTSVDYWKASLWYGGNLTADCEYTKQLDREIKQILPTIFRKSLNNSQTYITRFNVVVIQAYEQPRQEIISVHPDFLNNSQKYYYLIPKIPFLCFILKRIVIHGLSNFESFKTRRSLEEDPKIFTHTLLIRNIRGSMTLDYRSELEKALKLNFQINSFNLTKKDRTYCVYGHAKDYTITRANTNVSLSSLQSEVVMNRLQSALASALLRLPSKKSGQFGDLEMALEKIKISNSSDWETIKESYKKWIPFHNDEEVIAKKPFV
ncbi:uncharacterized protein LOC135837308 [Planococcus citri]|uniref:uncharacterized protein LOC135837308 n=1 Tax=Planococcus citri TaxID=170843 RepID=UPI0031F85D92